MLWTVFMLFMMAWMAALVLQFRLGAMPTMLVLTSILAFINVLRRAAGKARGPEQTQAFEVISKRRR